MGGLSQKLFCLKSINDLLKISSSSILTNVLNVYYVLKFSKKNYCDIFLMLSRKLYFTLFPFI